MLQKFVDGVERTSPDDFFCQEGTLNEIFELFVDGKNEARHVRELLCSDAGKKFIWDVYESFEFRNFESIVSIVFRLYWRGRLSKRVLIIRGWRC